MDIITRIKHFALVAIILIVCVFTTSGTYAGQSTITVVEGNACMGDDKSRKQTEKEALSDAKRKAVEYASTYLQSETRVKDLQVEKDLVQAYAQATVKIIEEIEKSWHKDAASGDCFKLKVKAEVIPDNKTMAQITQNKNVVDNPHAPLHVQIWTGKKEYRQSEKIKIYMKGNKPFYARVLYKDVQGRLLQLLPNAYRTDNYFNGGMIYEIPSGNDRFELEVSPPFGEENIIVYGSLTPLGDITLQESDNLFKVQTATKDVGVKTRGIKLKDRDENNNPAASEFFEGKTSVHTGKKAAN